MLEGKHSMWYPSMACNGRCALWLGSSCSSRGWFHFIKSDVGHILGQYQNTWRKFLCPQLVQLRTSWKFSSSVFEKQLLIVGRIPVAAGSSASRTLGGNSLARRDNLGGTCSKYLGETIRRRSFWIAWKCSSLLTQHNFEQYPQSPPFGKQKLSKPCTLTPPDFYFKSFLFK